VRIYADPSFLVSLLFVRDRGHGAARAAYLAQGAAEWVTSDWSLFETFNSLRQLCLRSQGPRPEVPEALRRYFKHLHVSGKFAQVDTDMTEALQECHQISTAHANTLRMRSADVLHVALLEQLRPDLFITRDDDQHALAQARAFRSLLVP
jgi:hypothetical protein